ncbi:MAG: isochorismatase family protein [Proteobacteria bacterium]|jgi:nicotinamidase/pyrazinamidase|nr:isochorismatase family protein [Alphaproteobacteria bacterium]NCC02976.1 isochorismatase family protein [Pseudomonadota bacterium]
MKKTPILVLIDIQNGFAKDGLTAQEGGSLYVPEGEVVAPLAADLIRDMRGGIVILSQDYHPADHASFAANHKGKAIFDKLPLARQPDGTYAPAKEGETVALEQDLWPDHCVQGTKSCLFSDEVMAALPSELVIKLVDHTSDPVLKGIDERGNRFFVIRKGMRSDLDSYGIATENDQLSKTQAPQVFDAIARVLKAEGTQQAVIGIGGLATNFCVEFSCRDMARDLVPALAEGGIGSKLLLLTDLSRGVPIPVADGSWPDLAAAPERMKADGAQITTSDSFRRELVTGRDIKPEPFAKRVG